jgi:hypothetical protein
MATTEDLDKAITASSSSSSAYSDLRSTIEMQNILLKKISDEKNSLEVWKKESEVANRQLKQELEKKA